MLNRGRHADGVLGCRRSIASMEFAIVAPLMLLLLGGVYDTSEALILYTEVYNCAHTIPASASDYAVRGTGATILTYDEIQLVESEIWADIPELRSGQKVSSSTSVTLTAVTFSVDRGEATCLSQALSSSVFQISSGCTYDADQLWSVAYHPPASDASRSTFYNELRACYAATQVAPTAPNPISPLSTYMDTLPVANLSTTGATIPSSYYSGYYQLAAGPAPILVTDVQFTYTPGFSFIFHGNVTFWVLGMWPVRNVESEVPLVFYSPQASWISVPNYPSGIVVGTSYFVEEPLQQQFTAIYGTETNPGAATNSTSPLYDPDGEAQGTNNDPDDTATPVPDGYSPANSWCVFNYANNPPPVVANTTSGLF